VHIRIFDNRVEVQSPGRLPAHVTVENILDERFARNGIVVRLLNKFPDPPNKDVGEGLNTAFEAMTNQKLKEPIIVEKDTRIIGYVVFLTGRDANKSVAWWEFQIKLLSNRPAA
jgi:ATP-dependent DNA helicase RecG